MRRSTACLAGLLCAACGRHEEQTAPLPSTPHEGLNVLSTGKGPLHPVRYHLAKGGHAPLELTFDTQMRGEGFGKNPVLVMDVEVAIDDVLPDGSARVRTSVTHATARGDAETRPELWASQAALLEGLAVVMTVAPDGRVTSTKVDARGDLPKQLDDSVKRLEQAVGNLCVPLPTVPIGIGASWQQRKTIEVNAIKLTADITYELAALDGDKLTLNRKATFSGSAQSIDVQGTKLDLKSAGGTLDGKSTIDLARMVMSDHATAHYKFDMVVTAPPDAEDPGGASTIEIDLTTTATPDVTPTTAPPPGDAGVDAAVHDAGVTDAKPPAPKKKPAKHRPKPKPDAGTDEETPSETPSDTGSDSP